MERARERGLGTLTSASNGIFAFAFTCVSSLALSLASPALAQPAQPAQPQQPAPSAQPADAASELDGWLQSQRDSLGRRCERRAAAVDVDRTLVACGGAGLWVVKRAPTGTFTLVAVQDLGGDVVGLFQRDGRVWAEIARLEARPVLRGTDSIGSFPPEGPVPAPSTPPGSATPPPRSATPPPGPVSPVPSVPSVPSVPREGRVTELGIGDVVVDLGREDGLKQGDRVELAVTERETISGQEATDRRVVAVGVVRTVAADFSRIELGINERVPLGASARLVVRGKTESRMAPPRAAGLWELMLRLRPFVALEGLGGGVLTQGAVTYRFESHFALAAELHPFGFATGKGADKATLVPAASFVTATYDHDVFGVGLGLGIQSVHDTDFETPSGTGTLVTQRLRLGARDGLMLDLRNDVVLFHSQFDFSGFVGSGMIPVGRRAWLLFEGGGGGAGYGYGEIGLRSLLRGNGQQGSLFLSVTLGGQGVFEFRTHMCAQVDFAFPCEDNQVYAGPMLGVGAEYRL